MIYFCSRNTSDLFFQGKDASMGLASGSAPLPYGHAAQPAIDIEGLTVNYLNYLYSRSSLMLA